MKSQNQEGIVLLLFLIATGLILLIKTIIDHWAVILWTLKMITLVLAGMGLLCLLALAAVHIWRWRQRQIYARSLDGQIDHTEIELRTAIRRHQSVGEELNGHNAQLRRQRDDIADISPESFTQVEQFLEELLVRKKLLDAKILLLERDLRTIQRLRKELQLHRSMHQLGRRLKRLDPEFDRTDDLREELHFCLSHAIDDSIRELALRQEYGWNTADLRKALFDLRHSATPAVLPSLAETPQSVRPPDEAFEVLLEEAEWKLKKLDTIHLLVREEQW